MRFLHHAPFMSYQATGFVRIILGLLLIYHGQELFHPSIMDKYFSWDVFQGDGGVLLVYVGKCAELLSGVLLLLGFLTRVGALLCVLTMLFITFVIGDGRVWYEDQHPFLFVLFGVLFFFTGPGAWSVDGSLFSGTGAPGD